MALRSSHFVSVLAILLCRCNILIMCSELLSRDGGMVASMIPMTKYGWPGLHKEASQHEVLWGPKVQYPYESPLQTLSNKEEADCLNTQALSLDLAIDRLDNQTSISDIVFILQKCRKTKDLSNAKQAHARIQEIGLEAHPIVGNHIVPMLVACGSMSDALLAFDKLAYANVHCWTSLISGYIPYGCSEGAFDLYQRMKMKKVDPSSFTFLALLKTCAGLDNIRDAYSEIVKKAFDNDLFVASCLIYTYIKCGSLLEAYEAFCKLPSRNVVVWNALVSGYAANGYANEVLNCFEQMRQDDVCPDVVSFVCLLKACGNVSAIERGQKAHICIVQRGYEDLTLGNTLIDMYAKCGLVLDARHVFDKLPAHSIVSWNALIGGYAEHGPSQEAVNCFNQMHTESISPISITFIGTLKACIYMAAIDEGRRIHLMLTMAGFDNDVFVGSTLIDMYAKCDYTRDAQCIFYFIPDQSTVTWNTIISAYVECGLDEEVSTSLNKMQLQGVPPNDITFTCSLKACASIGELSRGHSLHKEVIFRGYERDPFISSSLLDMYGKCGAFTDGAKVNSKSLYSNVVYLTALLVGHIENGKSHEALEIFDQIETQGISPNAPIFSAILKVFTDAGCINRVRILHAMLTAKGLEKEPVADITLVDTYMNCGSLDDAENIFFKCPVRDVVSWNVLIGCYSEQEESIDKVFNCFEQMQLQALGPNDATYALMLKVCSSVASFISGQKMHFEVTLKGFEADLFVGSSLVDMYAECGLLAEAQYVFEKLSHCSIVSWTSLIAGYSEYGSGQEVFSCYEKLQLQKFSPNAAILSSVLKACGSVGSLDLGRFVHREITMRGFEGELHVGNTLIDMYAKYGRLAEAQDSFGRLPTADVVSWNALIQGFGMSHDSKMAAQLFEEMQAHNIRPNAITFLCLLSACSHANSISKGQDIFKGMGGYGIIPTHEHYDCMIDLCARSGHLYEAVKLLNSMPCSASQDTLMLLLSACKTHAEPDLGLACFQQVVRLNPQFAVPYMLMSNLYGSIGRWDEVQSIEEFRKSSITV